MTGKDNLVSLSREESEALQSRLQNLRILEAVLFGSPAPLEERELVKFLPPSADLPALLKELASHYHHRGINLERAGKAWAFRTATDLAEFMVPFQREPRKLTRPATETLAIVAYHQPVTRAEIEEIRGVSLSKGMLDVLLETGWIRLAGRRQSPGRPVTYATTTSFLDHFGLSSAKDLPGVQELKAAGFFDRDPVDIAMPTPQEAEDDDSHQL